MNELQNKQNNTIMKTQQNEVVKVGAPAEKAPKVKDPYSDPKFALAQSVAKSFVKKANKKANPEQPAENAPQKNVIGDLLKFQSLFKKAETLYLEDEQKVVEWLAKDREATYFVTMLGKGTHSDKVSALSMLIQKNPSRCLRYLQQLIGLCRKHNRKQAEPAFIALKEVFTGHILSDGVKLTAFQYNPHILNKTDIANFDLIEAYQQHCVKEIYRDFITNVLVDLSKDDIEYYRKMALDTMVELMAKKPEIEEVILGILINKLGDSSKKIQGHTIQVLCKLLKEHPQMAQIVIQETHSLLQRSGLKTAQKYYACTFMNKIAVVCGAEPKARIALFRVYFFMFKNILQNPAERKELVFVKDRTKSKKVQVAEKKKSASKMKQIKANGDIDQDENKIVEQILKGVNVLMQKSKQDIRLSNHHGAELKKLLDDEMNTLFKLTHHNVFRIQIQVFKLLLAFAKVTQKMAADQISKKEDGDGEGGNFADRFYRTLYELLLKVHMSKATGLDDYFGLVFRAVKGDECVPRAIAFIKRLLQMSYLNECNFTAASLLVISEILKSRQDIRISLFTFDFGATAVTTAKVDAVASEDDDEERFVDVDKVIKQNKPAQTGEVKITGKEYDPLKREPKYANADSTQLFELASLCLHSHPTVRLWAQSLINGEYIDYGGDPLLDFSITNFLDRIAYKDPKSKEKLAKFANKRSTKMSDYEKPINEYDFKGGEKPQIIRKEEEFMYKYLSQLDKKKKSEVPDAEVDSDAEEVSDAEEEAFAEEQIKKEMKRLQGGQASDEDDEELDVSYSDDDGKASAQGDDAEDDDEEMDMDEEMGEDEQDEEVKEVEDDDSNADGQAGNFSVSEEDFFSDQEELEAVDSEQMGDEDEENEIGELGSEYGQEYDEEVDEQEEADQKKKKGKKVKGEMDGFATYEDFAHLLEDGAEEEVQKSKEKGFLKKRTFNEFSAAQHRFTKGSAGGQNPDTKSNNQYGFEMRKKTGEGEQSRGAFRGDRGSSRGDRGSFRGDRGSSRGDRGSSRGRGDRGSSPFRGGRGGDRGSSSFRGSSPDRGSSRGRGSDRGQSPNYRGFTPSRGGGDRGRGGDRPSFRGGDRGGFRGGDRGGFRGGDRGASRGRGGGDRGSSRGRGGGDRGSSRGSSRGGERRAFKPRGSGARGRGGSRGGRK